MWTRLLCPHKHRLLRSRRGRGLCPERGHAPRRALLFDLLRGIWVGRADRHCAHSSCSRRSRRGEVILAPTLSWSRGALPLGGASSAPSIPVTPFVRLLPLCTVVRCDLLGIPVRSPLPARGVKETVVSHLGSRKTDGTSVGARRKVFGFVAVSVIVLENRRRLHRCTAAWLRR